MTIALINTYRQAEDYFFRGIASKCLNLSDGAKAYMTGVPVADLNLVYIQKDTHLLHPILTECSQFFQQDKLDFVVVIPEEYATLDMQNILKTFDYFLKETSVSMVFDVMKFKRNLNQNEVSRFSDGLSIKVNDDKLNEWMIPLIEAYESNFEICSQYMNTHISALSKKIELHHSSLYKHGQPIASITLSLHNTIARIDDVGTSPEFQGNGYATRLMKHALFQAKNFGANYCFLEASASGLSIYQKLGFEPLFKNNIYSRKT